jgi:hypothetical protein
MEMGVSARVVLFVETVSIDAKAAISVPSDRARHFISNRNALSFSDRDGAEPALPMRTATHATQTRRVVFFCAVQIAARIYSALTTN